MANNRIYTKAAIEAIKEGLTHYYPFELGLIPQRKIIDDVWTDSNKIFKWDGLASFQKDLSDATKIDGFTGEKIKLASVTLDYLEHAAPEATVYNEADASPVTVNMPSKEVNEANQILADKARAQRESLKAKIHQETDAKIEEQKLIRNLKAGKTVDQGNFPTQKIKQGVTSTVTPLPKYFTSTTTVPSKPDDQDISSDSIFLGNLPKDELKRKADTENIIQEIRNAVERDQLVESIKKEEVPTSWTQPIQPQTTVTTTKSEPQEVVETYTQQNLPEYQIPKIEEATEEDSLSDQLFKKKVTVTEPEQQNESYRTPSNEPPVNELPPKQEYSNAEEEKTLIGIPAIPIIRDQPETRKAYSTQTTTETLVDDRPSINVASQPLEKDLFGPQAVVADEAKTVSETSTPSLDEALATIGTPVPTEVVMPKTELKNVSAPDLPQIKKRIPIHIPIDDQSVLPITESTNTYTKTVEPLPTTTEDITSTIPTKSKPIAETFTAPIVNEQQTAVIIDSTTPYIRPNNVAPITIDQEETQIQPENTINQSPKSYISIQTQEPAYEETISESPNQIVTPVSTQNSTIVSTTPVSIASTTSTSDQTYKEPDITNPVSTYTSPVAVVTTNAVSEQKVTHTQTQTYEQTYKENLQDTFEEDQKTETTYKEVPTEKTTIFLSTNSPTQEPALEETISESSTVESTPTQTYIGPIAVSPPIEETKSQPVPKEKIVTQSQTYKQTHTEVSTDQAPTDTITEAPVKNDEAKTETSPQTYTQVESNQEYEENFTTQPVYIPANITTTKNEEELKESPTKKSSISEAEIEQMHVKERIIQIKESINEKGHDYSKKVEEAQAVQRTLQENSASPQTDTKIYVKVTVPSTTTNADIKDLQNQASASPQNFVADVSQEYQNSAVVKDLPNSEAKIMADQAALTTYETVNNNSPLMQAAVINKIVDSPEILDKVTKDAKSQAVIKEASANVVTQKLAEHENLEQFVDVEKIGGSLKLAEISVEISDTPQEGYEEYSLNRKLNDEVVSPHIQSFEHQRDTLDDFGRELSDRGIGKAKGVVLDKAGGVLSRKMASLPQDSLLARTYNHDLVQKVLLPRVGLGGVPSAWTAVEGNWLGNYLVASGYGDVAGYLQGATGWNLGVAEVVTIGSGVAMAGGFSYYTTTALAIEYSAGTFASEAFLGGAGVSMAGSTVGVVGTESIAGAVGTGLGAESFTGFAGYSAGTFASEAFYGGAVATTTVATGTTVAGTAAVGAAAGAETGAAAGAATGAAVGGGVFSWATAAIGAAVGWLASKIDWTKVKSFLNNNKELLLVGGLAVVGTLPAVGITAILASMAAAISLGGYSFGGFFFGVWAFLRTIGRFFIVPLRNIAIGFGIIIVIVTIIMFIINNGAYVIPEGFDLTGLGYNEDGSLSGLGPDGVIPGSGSSGGFISNPYVGVTKTASPAGPFQNSQLPLTIKYTITITAKKETLTIPNGNIKDVCTSFTKNGQKPCPGASSAGSSGGITVTVGNPVTLSYSRIYDASYKDSINSNVVTVTALVASTTTPQVASWGTSILIGSPCGSGGSSAASAAMCIVTYLNQFKINPLNISKLSSSGWTSLTSVLPTASTNQLRDSVYCCKNLQCVGFVSATAGLAYGQGFKQIDACSYIGNAPPGYTYINGTSGIKSGDFFLIGSSSCSSSSPGHIGVVTSVSSAGPFINCADANYTSGGFARISNNCFALSQIKGYLRK